MTADRVLKLRTVPAEEPNDAREPSASRYDIASREVGHEYMITLVPCAALTLTVPECASPGNHPQGPAWSAILAPDPLSGCRSHVRVGAGRRSRRSRPASPAVRGSWA